jgi:hypothetical protein
MTDTASRHGQIEDGIPGDEISDEALERAAGAGFYTSFDCHPTDRCTAPFLPALFATKSAR